MKLWLALALVLLVGKGASQEAGKEVPLPSRKNPFILDAGFLQEGPQQPLRLHSLDLDLWKLATKVASEPPARPPGVGIGIGGPVGHLRIPLPPGQDGSGFEVDIYPRLAKKETGLMGISRVTEVAEHVTQRHYLGWFDHRELRKFCEAEGVRELAKRAQATPLLWFSMIEQKKGFPGVWVENLHVVNVSGQPLLIENVIFRVLKAGTTEELRKAEVVWPLALKAEAS